jgi:hypothetical protein
MHRPEAPDVRLHGFCQDQYAAVICPPGLQDVTCEVQRNSLDSPGCQVKNSRAEKPRVGRGHPNHKLTVLAETVFSQRQRIKYYAALNVDLLRWSARKRNSKQTLTGFFKRADNEIFPVRIHGDAVSRCDLARLPVGGGDRPDSSVRRILKGPAVAILSVINNCAS